MRPRARQELGELFGRVAGWIVGLGAGPRCAEVGLGPVDESLVDGQCRQRTGLILCDETVPPRPETLRIEERLVADDRSVDLGDALGGESSGDRIGEILEPGPGSGLDLLVLRLPGIGGEKRVTAANEIQIAVENTAVDRCGRLDRRGETELGPENLQRREGRDELLVGGRDQATRDRRRRGQQAIARSHGQATLIGIAVDGGRQRGGQDVVAHRRLQRLRYPASREHRAVEHCVVLDTGSGDGLEVGVLGGTPGAEGEDGEDHRSGDETDDSTDLHDVPKLAGRWRRRAYPRDWCRRDTSRARQPASLGSSAARTNARMWWNRASNASSENGSMSSRPVSMARSEKYVSRAP